MQNTNSRWAFTRQDTAIAKGVAVLLMLAHHLFGFPYRIAEGTTYVSMFSMQGSPVEYVLGVFGGVCVTMFMVLSGYGTYLSLAKAENPISVLLQKIWRVYKKVWGVFVVFIPLGFVLGAPNVSWDLRNFLLNFFGARTTYNEEWWFLTAFLCLMVLSPAVMRFLQRKQSNVISDSIWIVLLAVFVRTVMPALIALPVFAEFSLSLFWEIFQVTLIYLPQFLIGCVVAKYDLFRLLRESIHHRIVLMAGSAAFMLLAFFLRADFGRDLGLVTTALLIFSSSTLLREIPFVNKAMISIGNKSTGIWLTHSFFCYYYFQRFIYAPRYSPLIFLLLLAVSYASTCALDWLWAFVGKGWRKLLAKTA